MTAEGQQSVHQALSFIGTFLLTFGFIALFVGSFVIFNTFSIVVAQRLRNWPCFARSARAAARCSARSSASRWSSA